MAAMPTLSRWLLRLAGLFCFLVAGAVYLLLAHHADLTCDRAAGRCVLTETRPLRAVRVQTFPLPEVLDVVCQSSEWTPSSKSAEILKQARRPFDAGHAGVWESIGGHDEKPKFRVVLLTQGGVVPVTPHFVGDCAPRDAVTDVLDGRTTRGELSVGRWRDFAAATVLPIGFGLALFAFSAGRKS
jgi:hypothetical protein